MTIRVKFGSVCRNCTPVNDGVCKHCGAEIVWATTPAGKFVPLSREPVAPGVLEPHFGTACRSRQSGGYRARPAPQPEPVGTGIQMSETRWKQTLKLIHPDVHHGTANEALANDLTAWYLSQRGKLTKG